MNEYGKSLEYTIVNDAGNNELRPVNAIGLPAAYNILGNSVQYTASMVDTFSAGQKAGVGVPYAISGGTIYKYKQEDVRYVGDITATEENQCPYMSYTLTTALPNKGKL